MKDLGILFLRVFSGAFMIFAHGLPKLKRFFASEELKFADPLGIGVVPSLTLATFAEFFCSIFVMIGLLTRPALIPLIITMFVIVFIHHANDPFKTIELALLYMVVYITIFITGSGKFSIQNIIPVFRNSKSRLMLFMLK